MCGHYDNTYTITRSISGLSGQPVGYNVRAAGYHTFVEEENITVTESQTISVYLTPVGNDISSVNFSYPLNLYEATFSSRFGWRSWGGTEYFPKFNNHRGMDLSAESETAILSICDVLPNEFQSSYDPYEMGYHVIVTDNESGRTITYMHMIVQSNPDGLTTAIYQGDTIGLVGNTGNSDGDHLHIQIYDRGTWMYHDPSLYFPDYVN